MSGLTPAGRLARIVARGGKLQGEITDSIRSGVLHLTLDEVSQLTLTLADPEGRLSAAKVLGRGAQLDLGAYPLNVAAYEVGENAAGRYLTVEARSWGAQMLRQARGVQTWNLTPSQWVQRSAEFYGLKAVVQPTSVNLPAIVRAGPDPMTGAPGESSWDVLQRLADGLGFYAFESLGTVYFGRPSWLVRALPHATVTWKQGGKVDGALLRMPTCRATSDDLDAPRTIELSVTPDLAEKYRPGMALDLRGIPDFETRYLVSEVRIPLSDLEEATIKARTVLDPAPNVEALGVAGADATGGGDSAGNEAADLEFARFVNALVLQESGGSYAAVNARTGALGRYQVLPSNVGPWSKEILGRTVTTAEYLRQPALQDQIAIGMLRRYYEAHGARGAAARWYSGSAERQNDTTPVQGGREPSVKAYVDSVIAKMPTAATTLPAGYTGPGASRAAGDAADRPSYKQILALMESSGIPHRAISTVRDGAVTRTGNVSYHASGRAVDFAGPTAGARDTAEMLRINLFWAQFAPYLKELIYSGPGAVNINNGKPHTYRQVTLDDHHDHVHVAVTAEGMRQIAQSRGTAPTGGV